MFCRTYAVPAGGATSVADLIEDDLPDYLAAQPTVGGGGFRSDIIIQSPATNGNNVLLGDSVEQALVITAGGSSGQFRTSLNNLFVRGTAGDTVVIFLSF